MKTLWTGAALALIPAIAIAIPPPVPSKGVMTISEQCEGKTTEFALGWKLIQSPGKEGKYINTYIDVKVDGRSALSESQKESILRDLNKWTMNVFAHVANPYPFCDSKGGGQSVLLELTEGFQHAHGNVLETLEILINLNEPEKTGLYAYRVVHGTSQPVPAASAEIPRR